jgi:hypothetical protein
MRRIAAAARGEAGRPCPRGASTGLASIDSIGVASTTLPPNSPIDSEIAPMLRDTPAASPQ